MKRTALAVSGLALSAVLAGAPSLAQDRVDDTGATAALNNQISSANTAADQQAAAANAQYQAQQQAYQTQLQQNQAAQQDYKDKSAQYADQTKRYEDLGARYASERAAYHRGAWGRYERWTLDESDTNLIGQRVQILNGDRVGTVETVAHSPNGHVEALLVRLDSDKRVWIDQADIRYDRGDGVVMTNLARNDLRTMADESL